MKMLSTEWLNLQVICIFVSPPITLPIHLDSISPGAFILSVVDPGGNGRATDGSIGSDNEKNSIKKKLIYSGDVINILIIL